MKNIHIENSYNVWSLDKMDFLIMKECQSKYGNHYARTVLNRSYCGMYVEWYLHNIGYYLTLPFIKNEYIKSLNQRLKHVDLEEH